MHPRVTLKQFFKGDEYYRWSEKKHSHPLPHTMYIHFFSVTELHYFSRILEQNELVQLDLLDHNR